MAENQLPTDVFSHCLSQLAERIDTELGNKESFETFSEFYENLQIPSAIGPQKFGKVIADFQRQRFEQIAPSLEAISRGYRPVRSRFWWEATKGASKDADIAVCLLWLLLATRRAFFCQIGAADRDQANIVKKRVENILRYNPHLREKIEIIQRHIRNKVTQSDVEIVSADIGGSHGETPDVLILNELSHVTNREFFENMMDNAEKVPNGIVIIATNAGYRGTWHWSWRQLACSSDRWTVNVFDRPAPWITEEAMRDAAERNSPSRYQRLWHGIWSSGSGDAIDADLISQAVKPELRPMTGPEPGYWFTMGVDLGVARDHAGVVILGSNTKTQRIQVAAARNWEPERGGEVDLLEVAEYIYQSAKHFKVRSVRYDPYQAKLMAQALQNKGIITVEVPFVGKNLDQMASAMLETFREKRIDLYDDRHLVADLLKLVIVEKSYGYRLDAVRDEDGHADVATALAIALPEAIHLLKLPYAIPDISLLKAFEPDPRLEERLNAMVRERMASIGYVMEPDYV